MQFVRGDSFSFKVLISSSRGNKIKIDDIATIFVTCREYPNINYPILFQKTKNDVVLDNNSFLHIEFKPSDTENLDYGHYYFDIEITLNSGYIKTVLYNFELTKETTIHLAGEINGN